MIKSKLQIGERTCVHCGCTDSRACVGGCSWLEKHAATATGVCSQCGDKLAADTVRLEKLFALTDIEGDNGEWRVVLEYNNYQDVAEVRDGNGTVVGECGEIGLAPNKQFRKAIDAVKLEGGA